MGLNKKSVDDISVKGQKVLVRCDFNVPLKEGKITDENRLVAALPTIKKLVADGGRVILCSHLGKPKGQPVPELSLAPVAVRLSELLGQEVTFAADPEVVGPNAKAAVEAMKDGDVVLLENTRYRGEETKHHGHRDHDLLRNIHPLHSCDKFTDCCSAYQIISHDKPGKHVGINPHRSSQNKIPCASEQRQHR